ncbi:hypothetical protein V9T40_000907 [Parthenolecanium corni]|uniref:Uncharacterized protein n=1 Tax=Parthenolecanium corni TaxID=536013 RepID=A0AAN9TE87_9HEMI
MPRLPLAPRKNSFSYPLTPPEDESRSHEFTCAAPHLSDYCMYTSPTPFTIIFGAFRESSNLSQFGRAH